MRVRSVRRNADIIKAGDMGDRMFFICDGSVEVTLKNGTRLGNLLEVRGSV